MRFGAASYEFSASCDSIERFEGRRDDGGDSKTVSPFPARCEFPDTWLRSEVPRREQGHEVSSGSGRRVELAWEQ